MDGSDDLFGGLPAVSNAENLPTSVAAAISNTVDADHRPKPAPADDGKKSSGKHAAGGGLSSSLVSSLGTAGTAMAFVPHAIRNKRKGAAVTPRPRALAKLNTAGGKIPMNQIQVIAKEEEDGVRKSELIATDVTTWENNFDVADNGNEGYGGDENDAQDDANNNNDHANANEPYLENEPEELRLLHASVTQPYDPYLPNDYLAHRERKKTEQVRRDMQRSALQRLEQQDKLRKKIEEERKRMLESGDFRKIVERSRDGDGATAGGAAGRGRGRGVTNLPAWLVKKQEEQKEEEEEEEEPSSTTRPFDDERFDDAAT